MTLKNIRVMSKNDHVTSKNVDLTPYIADMSSVAIIFRLKND